MRKDATRSSDLVEQPRKTDAAISGDASMSGNDDGPDKRVVKRQNGNGEAEEHLLSEGRRISVWAMIGALVFVIAMVVLAFGVWTSGGPPAPGN
jgi:hypothetical protein